MKQKEHIIQEDIIALDIGHTMGVYDHWYMSKEEVNIKDKEDAYRFFKFMGWKRIPKKTIICYEKTDAVRNGRFINIKATTSMHRKYQQILDMCIENEFILMNVNNKTLSTWIKEQFPNYIKNNENDAEMVFLYIQTKMRELDDPKKMFKEFLKENKIEIEYIPSEIGLKQAKQFIWEQFKLQRYKYS